MTEESREVAEAIAAFAERFVTIRMPLAAWEEVLAPVVEAVRKDERERAYIEGWNAGVSASGGSELLHLVAAPAEGGTEG